jgi:hypothetical protein
LRGIVAQCRSRDDLKPRLRHTAMWNALLWRIPKTHMPPKLTPEIIIAAIVGFEQQKLHIDAKIAKLHSLLTGGAAEPTAAAPGAPTRKRRVSAAARRKMALAQKARWAKVRGESEPTQAAAPPTNPKRKLSAAAKAKLVANLKRARAAKAAKAKAAAKKAAPARKKTTAKKSAVQTAPAKAAKRAPVKKVTAKKTALAPSQAGPQTA